MNVGDLVKIRDGFCSVLDAEDDWIGIVVEMAHNSLAADEWVVQWAHAPYPANEFGYYLEVICK